MVLTILVAAACSFVTWLITTHFGNVKAKEAFLVKAAQDASGHFVAEVRKLKDEVHQHISLTEDNVSKVMQSVGMGLSQKIGDVHNAVKKDGDK